MHYYVKAPLVLLRCESVETRWPQRAPNDVMRNFKAIAGYRHRLHGILRRYGCLTSSVEMDIQ